jgi:hypothetical protein
MTRSFAGLAAMCLLLGFLGAMPAVAQPVSAQATLASAGPFTNTCEAFGSPLSPDTPVFIFWDANGNGPDSLDPVVPPMGGIGIPEDPFANFYMFYLDNPGFFESPVLTVYLNINAPDWIDLYLRIYIGLDDDSCYTSPVFRLFPDYQYVNLPEEEWTCGPAPVRPPMCQPSDFEIEFVLDNPGPYRECIETCRGGRTGIYVGHGSGNPGEYRPPIIAIDSGCEVPCRASAADFDASLWEWFDEIGWWMHSGLVGLGRGCITVFLLDSIPCARVDTFWAEPSQTEIRLRWTTSRETNADSFEVWQPTWRGYLRSFVGAVAAAGNPSGAEYSLVDSGVVQGRHYSYLLVVRADDGLTYGAAHVPEVYAASADGQPVPKPSQFSLFPSQPNPFNSQTRITFDLPRASDVRLGVFDLLGRRVASLAEGRMDAEIHSVVFDGGRLPSGVYLCQLEVGGSSAVQKLILLK